MSARHNNSPKRLAILTSGGPAPGLNSVINAATIEAINLGWEVFGIREGFRGLVENNLSALTLDDVAWIHFEGGSILGTSRVNPKQPEVLPKIVETLKSNRIDMLLTIGGDDTAFGASVIAEAMQGKLRTVHVPKTIDNDLPLPEGVPTFGYTTARHVGVGLVKNLMKDARTCGRWYVIISMGRQAGHLAMGMGKAAGATLTVIPEEFGDQAVTIDCLADILEGSVIKGRAHNRNWGVAVLAEGLIEKLDPVELERFPNVSRDSFGHIRLADIDLGQLLCSELTRRMNERKINAQFTKVELGYELRCADPVPFDIEYTRDLGFAATRFLAEGGTNAMVLIENGRRSFVSFEDMRDPVTGRTRVRYVDVAAESYLVARRYMQRLTRKDFDDRIDIERLAAAAKCSAEEFVARFGYLVDEEPEAFAWEDSVRDALDQG
ncbi:MAG: 6-phosphofructokinase [Bradymonadaceae bacterium]|nr:6-phosphofructokinase [Lujinxingiaceae bacterium]